MNNDSNWLGTILGFVGGGAVASLITALIQRKKAKNDIVTQNIETARQLRDDALSEYKSISEKLAQCRVLLEEAQNQLDVAKNYIETVCSILDEHSISYPPKPDELFGDSQN